MNFVSQMWKEVMASGIIWIVADTEVQFPYIEPPDDEEMPDFAILVTFSTKEGADDYRTHLIEATQIRPSELKVQSIKLDQLWELIEEMKLFCQEELDAKFRIELVHATDGQVVHAHDTIYVQQELSN